MCAVPEGVGDGIGARLQEGGHIALTTWLSVQSKENDHVTLFISGSSTGLGLMGAELLSSQGHQIVLHARNADRAADTRRALPNAEAVVTGDVETIAGTKDVAAQVKALGRFDAVIHNAAVGYRERHRATAGGLPHVSRSTRCRPIS
jgi:NAD(P)-dependent dehydrogenase (short-subunit alcohol dehydrogenase family)